MYRGIFVGVTTIVVASILLSGCVSLGGLRAVRGSGRTTTRDFDFADFQRLEIGSAFEVEVKQGDSYAVSVTVDERLVQYLDVAQRGDTVRIRLEPVTFTNAKLEATVTMPELVSADFSGAVRATLPAFRSEDEIKLVLSGASTVRGEVEAASLDLVLSGASRANLTGKAPAFRLRASGASTAEMADYGTEEANIDLSGASRGTVSVESKMDVNLSGASTLQYSGKPEVGTQSVTGASQLISR